MAPEPKMTDSLPKNLLLKLENMQVTGSFKVRGALNNLLLASSETKQRGVIVASGGSHGLSIAYAAQRLKIPATVILPMKATEDRVQRIESWGAKIVREGENISDSILLAEEISKRENLLYVHPFDFRPTWEGTGTVGLEIVQDVPDVDCALVAIGGGGLITGVATVLRARNPKVKIIGVEPSGAAKMSAAIRGGGLVELLNIKTIADTLAVRVAGVNTFKTCKQLVDEIVTVSDEMLLNAMKLLWREYNQLVEPAGAAVVAAALSGMVDLSEFRAPVAIICGGNAAANPVFSTYEERISAEGEVGILSVKPRP